MINPANTRPNLSSIILGILGREFNQERQKEGTGQEKRKRNKRKINDDK